MAYFAQLDESSTVTQVIAVSDEVVGEQFPQSEVSGLAFITDTLNLAGVWKQTSYNGNIRKNYAGIGFTYDETRDAFIPQKPEGSWELDEETCQWVAPVDYPTDGLTYDWDEDSTSWVVADLSEPDVELE